MAAADGDAPTKAVGPYLLQRTLGKGQTGLVRLGVHCTSRKTVAIKIINREKLSKSVLMKVEREIAIMKLIHHPHVLGLYDVYESNTYLYLVLEHVSGGELFDYLVKKGRLSEREARRFFRQIVSAVDFCHKHKVCHRDLKPENLLLDEHRNIKVADFGMASLQVGEKLLETSCGSPHYACPEVIRGEHYDGRKADVWSCGVILYALLVGALPFDDDNLRVLLEKVKRGNFHIPSYVPPGAQQLLKGMVEVNSKKRLTLDSVMHHGWFRGSHEVEPVPPMQNAVQTYPIETRADIDPDVFKSMSSLGCFKDKHVLASALLSPEHNEEKIVYFLLLSRKERQPCVEDEAKAPGVANQRDPPRKRVDSKSALSSPQLQLQRARAQSIGSANLDQLPPRSPRLSVTAAPNYSPSAQGYYTYNTSTPPTTRARKASHTPADVLLSQSAGSSATIDPSMLPPQGQTPWKRKLSQTMKHLVVSPRFHRKRYDGSNPELQQTGDTSSPVSASPQMAKRSWFANFRSERDKEEVVVVYRDKGLHDLKAALVQAFKVVNCFYEELDESSFKVKYDSSKSKGKNMFKKPVKLTVSLTPTQATSEGGGGGGDTQDSIVFDGKTFTLTFTQISGPTRRYRRVCEKLQAAIVNPGSVNRMSIEMSGEVDDDEEDGDGSGNPSLSSDDTLATNTASPILGDVSNSSHEEELGGSGGLLESTDDCESEDGLNSNVLGGVVLGGVLGGDQ